MWSRPRSHTKPWAGSSRREAETRPGTEEIHKIAVPAFGFIHMRRTRTVAESQRLPPWLLRTIPSRTLARTGLLWPYRPNTRSRPLPTSHSTAPPTLCATSQRLPPTVTA